MRIVGRNSREADATPGDLQKLAIRLDLSAHVEVTFGVGNDVTEPGEAGFSRGLQLGEVQIDNHFFTQFNVQVAADTDSVVPQEVGFGFRQLSRNDHDVTALADSTLG